MPKLKPGTIIPTDEEDAAITRAALDDPDALPLSEEEWEVIRPTVRVGRPRSTQPLKEPTTIRLSPEVSQAFRATGPGWQTRIDEALKQWLREHPLPH